MRKQRTRTKIKITLERERKDDVLPLNAGVDTYGKWANTTSSGPKRQSKARERTQASQAARFAQWQRAPVLTTQANELEGKKKKKKLLCTQKDEDGSTIWYSTY